MGYVLFCLEPPFLLSEQRKPKVNLATKSEKYTNDFEQLHEKYTLLCVPASSIPHSLQ